MYLSKNELILPCMKIRDCPDLKIRGIAQDISRGQVFTIENAKRYIRTISHYKMNFYCVYIEDMFAHPNHPNIGKSRGALTREKICEIDKLAKERFIEFVPIFECIGHVDNILTHKEYENLAEYPGAQCLNISNPQIYNFLEDFISEMSKAFPSPYFHIGCDESFDFGKYRSAEFIKKVGKDQAYVDFYEKLYQMVRSYGKHNVIMYDDILVNDKKVAEIRNGRVLAEYKAGQNPNSMRIDPLFEVLQREAEQVKLVAKYSNKRDFKGFITIIADRRIPFRLLTEVLYTAGKAEYGNYKFTVIKEEG